MNDKTQTTAKFDFAYIADAPINPESPWDNDVLQRQELANHLTNLVKGAEDSPFVISVNGGWGSGKTFMLKRWRQQLINSKDNDGFGGKAIYFNAWEDDFHANPLVAIIGQLWKELKQDDWKEIINSLKESMPEIVRKKCFDFFGLDKTDLQSTAEQTVDEYLGTRTKIDELKARLKMLADTVKEQTDMPLVFIVDELDRCRPTFAIELLERIKHVFDVPNIVFVFGINKKQLSKSIKSVYGEIDAVDYFNRFFDMDLILTQAESLKYFHYLFNNKSPDINELGRRVLDGDGKITSNMMNYMNLSLRQIQYFNKCLWIVFKNGELKESTSHGKLRATIYLILLKIKNPELYYKFITRNCFCKDVIDYFMEFIPEHVINDDSSEHNSIKNCIDYTVEEIYRFIRANSNEYYLVRESLLDTTKRNSRVSDNNLDKTLHSIHGIQTADMLDNMIRYNRLISLDRISGLLDLVDNSRY